MTDFAINFIVVATTMATGWIILFSLIGQATLGGLFIEYLRRKYYPIPDIRDEEIAYLQEQRDDARHREREARKLYDDLASATIKGLGDKLIN